MNALTREDFAAMTGAAYVPLCEASDASSQIASHYAEARHECIVPAGYDTYVFPVCRKVAWSILNNQRGACCPRCGATMPQRDFVALAGQVEVRP